MLCPDPRIRIFLPSPFPAPNRILCTWPGGPRVTATAPGASCDPRNPHPGKSTNTEVWEVQKGRPAAPGPPPGPRAPPLPKRPLYLQPTPHPTGPAPPRGGAAGAAAAPASTGRRRGQRGRTLLAAGALGSAPPTPSPGAPPTPRARAAVGHLVETYGRSSAPRRRRRGNRVPVPPTSPRSRVPAPARPPIPSGQLCPEKDPASGLLADSVPLQASHCGDSLLAS